MRTYIIEAGYIEIGDRLAVLGGTQAVLAIERSRVGDTVRLTLATPGARNNAPECLRNVNAFRLVSVQR